MSKSLAEMAKEVYENNVAKGWQPSPNSFVENMMMIVTETAEAVEAWREVGFAERTRENGKPDDVASELADVLIRLLDDCYALGIDLEAEFERKMTYNRTRSYRHGGKAI